MVANGVLLHDVIRDCLNSSPFCGPFNAWKVENLIAFERVPDFTAVSLLSPDRATAMRRQAKDRTAKTVYAKYDRICTSFIASINRNSR